MKKYLLLIAIVLFPILSSAQQKQWTLEECVEYALKNNIQIKNSALDIRLSEIDKKGAYGNFLPSVNASASHSWNIGLNQNITTGLLQNQTTQFTSLGGNVGVDIYNGLLNQNRLRRANLAIIATQYQLKKMQDDVSLNVANAYLQVLFNKQNIKVQNEQVALNDKQLNRTQELVNAGSSPRGDLLDIKATLADSKTKVAQAENALLISKLSLAQLLQLEDFADFDVVDTDLEAKQSEVMFQTPKSIYEKALENRVEVKLAKANLDIAVKDVRIARAAYQPNLQGFYSFNSRISYAEQPIFDSNSNLIGFSNPSFFNQFRNNKGQNFGLQLNIPILNGFTVRNNVDRAKVGVERSKISVTQSETDLERTIYQAFTDANGAFKTYESAEVAAEARALAFNYAKERFDVGMMNTFEYNQAQTLYSNAQSEVIRTKYDYIFRTKVVEFYFGIPIMQTQ